MLAHTLLALGHVTQNSLHTGHTKCEKRVHLALVESRHKTSSRVSMETKNVAEDKAASKTHPVGLRSLRDSCRCCP
ncbi:hypothetical protein NDU88_000609 [Pleurodeles waltl]|uniref:Secreted protein n=1 Tax=Pleurodeles waltl TaxID=8319 RepID=A0AAV7PA66_PLEWA|nr:hypothetical protein NDU88_000609 [Pleurodeles waltl]